MRKCLPALRKPWRLCKINRPAKQVLEVSRITYTEALEYIHTAHRTCVKHGLENMRHLLCLLGDPQNALRFVHIAGTNGKGSVAAMLASVLRAQGYKTGLYTSPFVMCFNERIRIGDALIPDDTLTALTQEVKEKIDLIAEPEKRPTEFQVITAIAFLHFCRQNCDIVVLETGMGGRLDPTNVIGQPLCSIITSISYDHMKYLGDTLSQIAFEKCGIIKPHGFVVAYPQQRDEALAVICDECENKGARLTIAPVPGHIQSSCLGNIFDCGGFERVEIPLAGAYQPYNAATVLTAVQVLRNERGVAVSDEAVYRGMKAVSWAGRFEILSAAPLVILDGAHNADAMAQLKRSMQDIVKNKPVTLVLGMLRDKQFALCAQTLAPIAQNVITTTVSNPRSASAGELAESISGIKKAVICPDPTDAAKLALELAGKNGVVLVSGSLYLIGELRQYFMDKIAGSAV